MNHLPPISDATGPYPETPYLCEQPYDEGLFASYPSRCGISISEVTSGRVHGKKITSFLQTWLFFGTLYEIFHPYQKPDVDDFIKIKMDGRKYITSSKLEELVTSMVRGVKKMGPAWGERELSRVDACLNLMRITTDALWALRTPSPPTAVLLSFRVLGATIDCATAFHLRHIQDRAWGLRALAKHRMRKASWCPKDIHRMDTVCSEMMMFYMSYLHRYPRANNHGKCTELMCRLDKLDAKRYEPSHVSQSCTCDHVVPDIEAVKRILRHGKTPAITLFPVGSREDPDEVGVSVTEVDLKNVMSKNEHRLRAISHVWSDGLGNETANSLPRCQLRRLYVILKDLYSYNYFDEHIDAGRAGRRKHSSPKHSSPKRHDKINVVDKAAKKLLDKVGDTLGDKLGDEVYRAGLVGLQNTVNHLRSYRISIWIDTLCIPQEMEFKSMAIQGMDQVYSDATSVTVLDAELQACTAVCTPEELLARLATSAWMGRAWTYPEFILSATSPTVKFKDTLVDLRKVFEHKRASRSHDGSSDGLSPFAVRATHSVSEWAETSSFSNRLRTEDRTDDIDTDDTASDNGAVPRYFSELWSNLKPYGKRFLRESGEEAPVFSMQLFIRHEVANLFSSVNALKGEITKHEVASKLITPAVSLVSDLFVQNFAFSCRVKIVWNELSRRVTKHDRDKFLIFTIACGAESSLRKAIFEERNQEKRMQLWLSQEGAKWGELPAGLLFVKGVRLTMPGLSWAPRDLSLSTLEDDEAIPRREGALELEIRRPGFVVDEVAIHRDCETFYCQIMGRLGEVRVQWESAKLSTLIGVVLPLGVILSSDTGSTDGCSQQRAALIALDETGNVLKGTFLATTDVIITDMIESRRQNDAPTFAARTLSSKQWWIIG